LRLFFHQSANPFGGVVVELVVLGLMPVVMGKSWNGRGGNGDVKLSQITESDDLRLLFNQLT
jgi:hypothetical protein